MKQHARRYIVLVLAQAACLALGLWLEFRFVTYADRFEAKSSGSTENATRGSQWYASVENMSPSRFRK